MSCIDFQQARRQKPEGELELNTYNLFILVLNRPKGKYLLCLLCVPGKLNSICIHLKNCIKMLKQSKIMLEGDEKGTEYVSWHENLQIMERGLEG